MDELLSVRKQSIFFSCCRRPARSRRCPKYGSGVLAMRSPTERKESENQDRAKPNSFHVSMIHDSNNDPRKWNWQYTPVQW